MNDRQESLRLFVGLAVPGEIAERLARHARESLDVGGASAPGVRTYPGRDLHLTLAFLGAVSPDDVARLEESLRQELAGLSAPELSVGGAGAFPSRGEPRVLWAGVEETGVVTGRLATLRNRSVQAGMAIGWRPPANELSRPYLAHVTVARVRRGARVPEGYFDLTFERPWLPVEVTLFESRPDLPGERYRPLASVPLAVRPG